MPGRLRARKPPKTLHKVKEKHEQGNQAHGNFSSKLMSAFDPVDNTPLVFFRCVWGLVMMYDSFAYIQNDYRKLENDFMRSDFYPKYYGFLWVDTLPGLGMYYLVWAMLITASGITFGSLYHVSASLFFLLRVYIFLLDASLYSDQSYLIVLISFLMIFLPANSNVSVDTYLSLKRRSTVTPKYSIFLLQFQQAIVYFYFGIARMNEDWIRGEPIRHWILRLVSSRDAFDIQKILPLFVGVGDWLIDFVNYVAWFSATFLTSEAVIFFLVWSIMIFSVIAGVVLLSSREKVFVWTLCTCFFFHLACCWVFKLGSFPYAMMAGLTLFFKPQWIRSLFSTLFYYSPSISDLQAPTDGLTTRKRILLCIMSLFIAHQVLTPWRPLLYPGEAVWNELGSRYTWEMGVRDKYCEIELAASDPFEDKTFRIDFHSHLYGKQPSRIMPHPELVIQFCHYIADKYQDTAFGGRSPVIKANLLCELNDRGKQQLLDPNIDLARINPHNWKQVNQILSPIKPLSPSQKKQFPFFIVWKYFCSLWGTCTEN